MSTAEAKRRALRWLPQSDRQLARRLRRQAKRTRDAKKRSFDEARTESTRLQRLLLGVEKRMERREDAEDPEKGQELARLAVAQDMVYRTQMAMLAYRKVWATAKTPKEKQEALRRFQVLGRHRNILLARIRSTREALGLEETPKLQAGLVSPRKVLRAGNFTVVPPVTFTIPLIRLVASRLGRKTNETDQRFKARLRAYTQRALLRALPLLGTQDPDAVLEHVAAITVAEDAPSIEAEVSAGAIARDEDAELMDAILAPANDEFDAIVEDMQPPLPAGVDDEHEIDVLLDSAETQAAALAESEKGPQDFAEDEVGIAEDDDLSDALYPAGEEPNNGSRVPSSDDVVAQLAAEIDAAAQQAQQFVDTEIVPFVNTEIVPAAMQAQIDAEVAFDAAKKKAKSEKGRKVVPFALLAALGLLIYAARD